jgi:hypothetical protein
MQNIALVSSIRTKDSDSTLLFSSSSNFDYGQIKSEIFAKSIEAKTGKLTTNYG